MEKIVIDAAGLLTGCVYDYFLDKDDILIEAIKMHHETNNQIARKKLKEFPLDMEIEELMDQVCHDLLLDERKEIDAEIYIKECAGMLAHLLQA